MKPTLVFFVASCSMSRTPVIAWSLSQSPRSSPELLQTYTSSVMSPYRSIKKHKYHTVPMVPTSFQRFRSFGTNLRSSASAAGEVEPTKVNMMTRDDHLSSSREISKLTLSSTRKLLSRALLLGLLALGFSKRLAVLEFLDYVKNEWLMTTLHQLSASGPKGLTIYSITFCIWTVLIGVTTPVETAAGMAFGARQGILASGSAKFLAALATFILARHRFADRIRPVVEGNEVLSLMEESIRERPFQVALLCRFSPLPEIMKNAGMGVSSVKLRDYIASLVIHGVSFTCLWTWMGAETARVLEGFPPSATLKYLLTAATWIGFVAPVCIGLWLKSLRDKREERRQQEASSSTSP